MEFKRRTVTAIADMICGNTQEGKVVYFKYRSSYYLTQFFRDCDTDYEHKGETRNIWVADVLTKILNEAHPSPATPPPTFSRVIRLLMDPEDKTNEESDRRNALELLNLTLAREGFQAFYDEDKQCYIRHIATQTVAADFPNPNRPFSPSDLKKREQLVAYLEKCSEDELIEEILLPLFRQLGFHRITASGHKDKAMEYGKDVWMRYRLPTQHFLYFGIQAKKDKLDAAGLSKGSNQNISEVYNQLLMMIGHEIFDPETSKKALVDHAFIVAGGEITKAAKNWLGGNLDASKRSQIMFMDREDILNLYVVTGIPLPSAAIPEVEQYDDIPF